jgi:hypothetical protein
MAHFAQIDENNIVTQVIAVCNEELLIDGIENESKGILFCQSLFGQDTKWIQTSYNNRIRKNYASINFTYNEEADVFYGPKPYLSWTLDSNFDWQPPTPKPVEETKSFVWDESTLSWIEIVLPL